ncbi:MAG: ABC transporter permease, partial [Paracoccus sp. (in: a-proteobacteria)]
MANALDPHAAIVTTAAGETDGTLTTADGRPLARALARSQRRAKRRAFLLVLPLLAFILITFVVPIGQMLQRSFYNDGFSANMPQISAWFANNPRGTPPDDAAWTALATDLQASAEERSIGVVGT